MSFVTCMWWQRVDFCQKRKKGPKMWGVTSFLSSCGTQGNGVCFRHILTAGNTWCYYMCPAEPGSISRLCRAALSYFVQLGEFFLSSLFLFQPTFNQSTSSMLRWFFWRTTHHRGFITLCTDKYWQTQTQYHKGERLICHHLCAMLMNMNKRCKHFVEPVELKYKKRRKFRGLNCFL